MPLNTNVSDFRSPTNYMKLSGHWEIKESIAKYSQELENEREQPFGLVFWNLMMGDGTAQVDVSLDTPNQNSCARIVFRGGAAGSLSFYSAGLGGWGKAYTISRYTTNGWQLLNSAGNYTILDAQFSYRLKVTINGPQITMNINDSPIPLSYSDNNPIEGRALGLVAWKSAATFKSFKATALRPIVFVAMEYSDTLQTIYNNVIFPVAVDAGFECRRAIDARSPGIIIDDIHDDIRNAAVIIAELSSRNPNVYYEIGFASGEGQETILLAETDTHLPFNLSLRRCIFYENSNTGLDKLKIKLRDYLKTIIERDIQ
ncbi:MAG TPA: hypothetical protein ACFYEF_12585 [Candidatus Wunengus sp. YC63]|uniref:hypothetical protein n=1 Tax=Candidatus Wunengus sp. YC63 TaxID=3367699 RepID=UPI002713B95D|nr:hypothetical protein [Candidatus Brocadiales bacterium]